MRLRRCSTQVVFLYMLASFFQGGAGTGSSGMLNNARSYLWIPIGQNAFRYHLIELLSGACNNGPMLSDRRSLCRCWIAAGVSV